jgi:hypothetical protein
LGFALAIFRLSSLIFAIQFCALSMAQGFNFASDARRRM